MTSPAKPARVRYVRDRETDARWVSAEAITRPAIVRAEMARLRAAGRTVTTLAGRIYVDWLNEPTPNPGRRAPRPGGTQPESERKRKVLPIRLSEAARTALDAIKAISGESRSAVVERLILAAVVDRPVPLRVCAWTSTGEPCRCGRAGDPTRIDDGVIVCRCQVDPTASDARYCVGCGSSMTDAYAALSGGVSSASSNPVVASAPASAGERISGSVGAGSRSWSRSP